MFRWNHEGPLYHVKYILSVNLPHKVYIIGILIIEACLKKITGLWLPWSMNQKQSSPLSTFVRRHAAE